MDTPVLFVGDLQERLEVLDAVLTQPEHPVFLGDILDSFTYKSVEHIAALDRILDAAEKGAATLLMGNHEASYLWRHMAATGQRPELMIEMQQRKWRYLKVVKMYRYWAKQNVLATHAGVTNGWYEAKIRAFTPAALEKFDRASRDPSSWFFAIGRSRGGSSQWGGPLWCDWYAEFTVVPGLRQVVGHSKRRNERPKRFLEEQVGTGGGMRRSPNGDWCVDCLHEAPEVLFWDPATDTWEPRLLG